MNFYIILYIYILYVLRVLHATPNNYTHKHTEIKRRTLNIYVVNLLMKENINNKDKKHLQPVEYEIIKKIYVPMYINKNIYLV